MNEHDDAWDWLTGRRSHLNEFLMIDSRAENRTLVLAHVAMADAAEATRAAAVIEVAQRRADLLSKPRALPPEAMQIGSLRPSREDVWIDAYKAAITGLCTGVDADDIVLPRGPKDLPGQTIGDAKAAEERGQQRRRKIIGAAALLADRALLEWSLHWPADEQGLRP